MLELDNDSKPIKKKISTNPASLSTSKNQTKLIKSTNSSSKNQTKQIKTSSSSSSSFGSTKNQTKLSKSKLSFSESQIKPSSTITKSEKLTFKSQLQKLNLTPSKSSNSTKITSSTIKKSSEDTSESKSKNPISKTQTPAVKKPQTTQKKSQYSWLEDEDDDMISEFRDLPSKFHETFLPDLEKISKTSQVYLNKANKEITKNFKPYVGNKYAPTIASLISFAFILIPLILVSLIFNKIKAYFSLQKLLIFIQVYLSIYFSILCLSSLVTGLEPLKFFYATAQSTYICLQLLQTLAYVLYLLMLLMYLILVFSTETGPTTKLIGLAQTIVGFAVGLHYYMTVFHRAVLHQPPKTSWRVHAIYATFFLVICISSSADRRKKAYLVEGGEVEKKS
ncbi:hypothetical protein MTR67_013146 [Solanum verrucosum]|uniref:Uncharacterized protein n=1 Tax=Solanum verrucosum TaxID=315347 RepID=A0AAF0THN3_SOLVR|nr:hypothetical protein MTR67_013146 [Solanum verrucosum]